MNAFVRKLGCYGHLDAGDRALVTALTEKTRLAARYTNLVVEGEATKVVHVILQGWAIRHKTVRSGRRQIFGYLLPGDICDLHVALMNEMDHTVTTVCDCAVAEIHRPHILDIVANRPALMRALWWTMVVDGAVLREWVTNIGARDAKLRIAHLFCEVHARLQAVGLVSGGTFRLPLTQQELADTVGISVVHVNRSLRVLRERRLASFRNQIVEIPSVDRLRQYSDFSDSYLHFVPSSLTLPGSLENHSTLD